MRAKSYSDELDRVLARSDVEEMRKQLDAYARFLFDGDDESDEAGNAFDAIGFCYLTDPDKAFAYVILGAARSDDPRLLASFGCGPLEDVLRDPSTELLARVVAQARKSRRFRWMLSFPFKIAVAPRAWQAIEKFRITGPHAEPPEDLLPPRE